MKLLRALLAAIAGMIGGYALAATFGVMLIDPSPGDSGGTAMGIFFGIAPIGAAIGAIAAFTLILTRKQRD